MKDISYLELWQPLCSADQNYLCNFDRGHEEHFCDFILNLDQWFRGIIKSFKINFLSRALEALFSTERNY